jgi:small multidrug resistance pump
MYPLWINRSGILAAELAWPVGVRRHAHNRRLRDTEVSYTPIEHCAINGVAVMNEEAWWRSIPATAFNHLLSRPRGAASRTQSSNRYFPNLGWTLALCARRWCGPGLAEVAGTAALKVSAGFTKPVPSIVVVVSYAIAFFFLGLTLRTIPVGIAYAVWGGAGIALIVIAGAVLFNEIPDLPAIIGVGLILVGVVIVNTMSLTTAH